jgi:hypothetical protein
MARVPVCLWEADSVDAVSQVVEESTGDVSSNENFEVNADNAQGLPGLPQTILREAALEAAGLRE